LDIVENAEKVMRYAKGLNEQSLMADKKTRDAIERCLQRISEAAISGTGAATPRAATSIRKTPPAIIPKLQLMRQSDRCTIQRLPYSSSC
jgi:uncharacterized protein with HEPN domain